MTPLPSILIAAMLSADVGSGAASCFRPEDQSRGWKKVAVPTGVAKLSAPDVVPQIAHDLLISTVAEDAQRNFVSNDFEIAGKATFHFYLDPGTYRLKLKFAEGVGGAKVDVTLQTAAGTTHPLWSEKRTRESLLDIQWDIPGATTVDVAVHHHLRKPPNLTHWTSYRRLRISDLKDKVLNPGDPLGPLRTLDKEGTLYYFNEGGALIALCPKDVSPVTFDEKLLAGFQPVPTAVKPASP